MFFFLYKYIKYKRRKKMTTNNIMENILTFLNSHPVIKIFLIANIIIWGYFAFANIGKNIGQLIYYLYN